MLAGVSQRVKGMRVSWWEGGVSEELYRGRRDTGVWDSAVLRDPFLERDAVGMHGVTALVSFLVT